MTKTLKKISLASLAIIATTATLTACPGGAPPTGTGGNEKASISGTVTKEDGSPAKNATVVLIKKDSDKDSDADIQRSDDKGLYTFSKVAAGNYRVAFVIQTEAERKAGTPIAYDPAGKSGEFFGFITTKNFDYDGDATKTFQVPQFNVGWKAALSPNNTGVDAGGPIKFSWAKAEGAEKYNVFVKDENDNSFFKSADVTDNSFTWENPKGNQGTNKDKALSKGKYLYLVNVIFKNSGEGPVLTYGGSANASFTVN